MDKLILIKNEKREEAVALLKLNGFEVEEYNSYDAMIREEIEYSLCSLDHEFESNAKKEEFIEEVCSLIVNAENVVDSEYIQDFVRSEL